MVYSVNMPIPFYSRVRFITNRFEDEGVSEGTIGYVIEIHDEDAYEVEVSDSSGHTIALVVTAERDLAVDEPSAE